MEEYWWLSRYRPPYVKQVESEIKHCDPELRLYWNTASEYWEVWHIPARSGPYCVGQIKGEEGERLVPGIGISADTIMDRFVRPKDFLHIPNSRNFGTNMRNETAWRKQVDKEKFNRDIWDTTKEERVFMTGIPRKYVPRNYGRQP